MKIRAITLGLNIVEIEENYDHVETILHELQEFKKTFKEIGIEVETIRICTPPFTKDTHLNQSPFFTNPDIVLEAIDDFCDEGLVNYYSAFPGLCDQTENLTNTQKKLINRIPDLLKSHDNMFSSIQVSSKRNGINFEAIHLCANLIKQIGAIDPFLNLKFATTFNVPPNTPFFPSAYHLGKEMKISVALEAADEIINITKNYCEPNCSLDNIRKKIQARFSEIYDRISGVLIDYCEKKKLVFEGIDFSPAQYPIKEKSIGTAIENFGLSKFGELGTVFSTGFLTSTLQSIDRPKIGFSGFMQPLLEDYTIALRNNEGHVDLTKLLLNSTVCGLGLDCIPLPGNVEEEPLALLMMDTAMISSRLNKPLTARLMPITDKKAGETTTFDFEYFTNSKICDIKLKSGFKVKDFVRKNPGFQLFD